MLRVSLTDSVLSVEDRYEVLYEGVPIAISNLGPQMVQKLLIARIKFYTGGESVPIPQQSLRQTQRHRTSAT